MQWRAMEAIRNDATNGLDKLMTSIAQLIQICGTFWVSQYINVREMEVIKGCKRAAKWEVNGSMISLLHSLAQP